MTITLCDTSNYVTVTLWDNHKTYVTSIFVEITFRNSDFFYEKTFCNLKLCSCIVFFLSFNIHIHADCTTILTLIQCFIL